VLLIIYLKDVITVCSWILLEVYWGQSAHCRAKWLELGPVRLSNSRVQSAWTIGAGRHIKVAH